MATTRGRAEQHEGIEALKRRLLKGALLDVNRVEAYGIDQQAVLYCKGRISLLRAEVERLARTAVMRADRDIQRIPESREMAERVLSTLAEIDRSAKWLIDTEIYDLSSGFVPQGEQPSAAGPLSQISDRLKAVRVWHSELASHYEIRKSTASRSEFLAGHFVDLLTKFHQHQTGKRPPKSRGGQFVRFVQEAWSDLDFPEIPTFTLAHLIERSANRN